jgi:hypothetical protein
MSAYPLLIRIGVYAVLLLAIPACATAQQPRHTVDPPEIEVLHLATCVCCKKWIEYLEDNDFTVIDTEVIDVNEYKRDLGVPPKMYSCHTATVNGYVVEGHVSADEIFRLLKDKPDVVGLAVPRMPKGAPGMEDANPEPYTVFTINSDSTWTEFARHDQ